MYCIFIREHSTTSAKLLCALTLVRSMGGGPRTFPGGLNKWQWKRLHEKKAREKEKKLLAQEKQLYQARIRSQIRAKLTRQSDISPDLDSDTSSYSPMTPSDQIKALADRFMSKGAEDLWNEADGPIKSPPPRPPNQSTGTPFNLRKLFMDSIHSADSEKTMNSTKFSSVLKPRHYSIDTRNRMRSGFDFRRRGTSDRDYNLEKVVDFKANWPRYSSYRDESLDYDEDDEDEEEEMTDRGNGKKLMSNAALGKYDVIKRRRVPLKFLEEEVDLSQEVETIRYEFNRRRLKQKAVQKSEGETILSEKRFEDCNISPLTVKALTSAGYLQMTRVQEATLSAALDGKDVLVKAKSGTGKTAAFLLPAIETVLKFSNCNSVQRVQPIYALILCPTRELASQIAAEVNVMLKYHDGIGVQTLVGGTRFKVDQKRLEANPCQVIVATPGRLLDHIENKSGFSVRLMGLKMLILDEADHLLDLGFRKDLEKIVDCVSRQRQSLLFSATIPKEVRRISQLLLKREHTYIDTVGLGGCETPSKIKQSYLVEPHELHFQTVHHVLKEHISRVLDYKVIVFCTTAMMTSLTFLLLKQMKMNVREIHSRKPQLYRTRISDEFRESKRLILVTSDVSSRGMNYPDVTLVIQMGIPSDREQYIHRLGRSGREGKEGEGILLLAPWEEYFLDNIKDLPMERFSLPQLDAEIKVKMDDSIMKIDTSVKEAAYHAWLGYYNSIAEIGRDKTTLVELAKRFSESIGLQKPPALFRKTALKMGLKDIPGIQIRK